MQNIVKMAARLVSARHLSCRQTFPGISNHHHSYFPSVPVALVRHKLSRQCLLHKYNRPKTTRHHKTPRHAVMVTALSVGDVLGVSGTAVLATTLLAAVTYSALPLLRRRAADDVLQDPGDINDDDIKWTVMGIISCLPFVNWTAWIFAALDDPQSASRYYLFAALYALPLLTEGLSLDGTLLAATALCALHVQVERVVATQPSSGLLPPSPPSARSPRSDTVVDDANTRDTTPSTTSTRLLETDRASRDALPLEDPRRRDDLQAAIDRQLQEFDTRLGAEREDARGREDARSMVSPQQQQQQEQTPRQGNK